MNFFGSSYVRRFKSLLMRQNFSKECEKALNKQINMELKACHNYLAMAYHFDRADVASQGIYSFFKEASAEERTHAEKIMEYMNKRGGLIILTEVPAPDVCCETARDALVTALKMEMEVNQSLLEVHALAGKENDPNLCDFIETNFLQEQVDGQKFLADLIRQYDRCDKELGLYIFDQKFINNGGIVKK